MSYAEYGYHATITFTLPFWIMDEEFQRPPQQGQQWERNAVEDEIAQLDGVEETCLNHQCWVTVIFKCEPHQLPDRIELFHQKLETILRKWAKQRKGGGK